MSSRMYGAHAEITSASYEIESILKNPSFEETSTKLQEIFLKGDETYIESFWISLRNAIGDHNDKHYSIETLEKCIRLYTECCSSSAKLIESFKSGCQGCLRKLTAVVESGWYDIDEINNLLVTFNNSWNAVESDKSFDNVEEKVHQHSEHIPEIQAYWKSSADDSSQPPPIFFHKCVFTTFIEVYKEAAERNDSSQQENLCELFRKYFEKTGENNEKAQSFLIRGAYKSNFDNLIKGNRRSILQLRCCLKIEWNTDLRFSKALRTFRHDSLKDDKETIFIKREGQALIKCVRLPNFPVKMVAKLYEEEGTIDIKSCRNEILGLMDCGNHPHIVTIFGIVEKLEVPIGFLMEYCEDGSLHDAVYDVDYDYKEKDIISWTMQAASALIFLHERKIIHRDIKPKNMLLSNERKLLQVSDLGLIKLNPQSTRNPTTAGTPVFTAPELRKMLYPDYEDLIVEANVDKRVLFPEADIYSLGASIYETIFKEMPPRELWEQKNLKQVKGEYHLRSSLKELMTEMVRKFPKTRPNATKVYQILEKLNEQ